MTHARVACTLALGLLTTVPGCVPKAPQLPGVAAPRATALPPVDLPPGTRQVTFNWRYDEQDGASARGEGVTRLSPPDTARLSLFLAGGFGAGRATLTGDHLEIPQGLDIRRFLPAPPLLWAALGRLRLPAAADTTIRVAGDTLRADVGRGPTWRLLLVGGRLRQLQRIDAARVVESVDRDSSRVVYSHAVERRTLRIDVVRDEPMP